MPDVKQRRVLICAPLGKDAELACQALEKAGLLCCICPSITALVVELVDGAGALLIMEEVLTPAASVPLVKYLVGQPTWSDLPVLVLTKSGGDSLWIKDAYERFGNLTLLERPVRAPTLISAVRSALRARLRQYEIQLSDARKDEFLAMLAHELRNPLAPISAAAQILKLISFDPEKVMHSSEIIARQVAHMTNLIDDLLDVARVTRGLIVLEREPLDMRQIVSQAVEQVNPQINAKCQHLALHLPPESMPVLGDSKRLIQVVANLLNNASKYTQDGGSLAMSLGSDGHEIILQIVDDGIGISAPMVSRVFELFAQAERTSDRSQGGLGLGLALVKSLALSHGGSVHAASKGPGEGSTFTLRLPRLLTQENNITEKPSADPQRLDATKPLRVMVVDDNVDAADTLAMLLDVTGYNVVAQYTAANAIVCAKKILPEICILDIGLPDMDGNALASKLRAMPETAEAILIAVTGYSQDRDKGESIASGFDYHFVKPVDTAKLLALLASTTPSQSPP